MSFADYIKVFELKPRYLFTLWFLGAVVLLMPSGLADRFGFSTILNPYRGWIGLGTMAVFTLWLVQLWSSVIWPRYQSKKQTREAQVALSKSKDDILASSDTLSRGELLLLAFALADNQQTLLLNYSDPFALALCNKGLLEMASSGHSWSFPFTIPNFVWEHLQQHKVNILPADQLDNVRQLRDRYEATPVWRRYDSFR